MMTTEEQIGALSTAVLNTDKARRVGWARAYSGRAGNVTLIPPPKPLH